MDPPGRSQVSQLLAVWNQGDEEALGRLAPLVYDELRALAGKKLHRERSHHTLRPTEVVHEAFMRLVDQRIEWRSRAHFLGIAGRLMRRVLIDHARRKQAAKRPSAHQRVTLSGLARDDAESSIDPLDLESALVALEALDPRAVRVVELRAFAGCTAGEAAAALEVSEATIAREWRFARKWLRQRLADVAPAASSGAEEADPTALPGVPP